MMLVMRKRMVILVVRRQMMSVMRKRMKMVRQMMLVMMKRTEMWATVWRSITLRKFWERSHLVGTNIHLC